MGDAVKHLDDAPKDPSVDLAVGDRTLGSGGLASDLVNGAAASQAAPSRPSARVREAGACGLLDMLLANSYFAHPVAIPH